MTFELPLDIEPTVPSTPPKELSPEVERERRNYLSGREHQLPGFFAPAFHLLDEKLAITVTPCADPMTPMYMLDRNFRIIDWNLAFNMCFDRTMEGRRGRNVLEWTYFLDNYEEALNHGIAVFGEGKESPRIDIEKLTYTSDRYVADRVHHQQQYHDCRRKGDVYQTASRNDQWGPCRACSQ